MSRHPRRRLDTPQRTTTPPPGAARPLAPAAPGASLYGCPACEQQWPYPAVRHTGRCPTCGGGLLRLGDPPEG